MSENTNLKSKVSKILGFSNKDEQFTAQRAWIETCYGQNAYRDVEERIREKQEDIKRRIDGKSAAGLPVTSKQAFYCFVNIEDDLVAYTDEILKPFADGGFTIVNVSETIDELKDDHVYLISWKNAFAENGDIVYEVDTNELTIENDD